MKAVLFFVLILTLVLNLCLSIGFTHGSYAYEHIPIKGNRNGTQYTALGGEGSFHQFTTVSFSHDSSILATLSIQGRALHLWDVSTGTYLKTLTDQISEDTITSISFSPNDSILATGNQDGTVHLWDISTGTRLKTLTVPFTFWESVEGYLAITILSFSHDGSILATGNRGGPVRLWDVSTGTLIQTLRPSGGDITSILFSRDDNVLATLIENDTVRLWDVSTGTFINTFTGPYDYFTDDLFSNYGDIFFDINGMSISPDGKTLALGIRMIPIEFLEEPGFGVDPLPIASILAGFTLGLLSLVEIPTGDTDVPIYSEPEEISTVWLWDTTTGQQKSALRGYFVDDVSFSPDGNTLATGSGPSVNLWDVSTGKLRSTLHGPPYVIWLSFSPDGSTLAAGNGRGTVHLWDVSTNALRKILIVDEWRVIDVSFSPDGTTLAINNDGQVLLWDVGPSGGPRSPIEDVNNDGTVNVGDLMRISAQFGQIGVNRADVNGDTVVDIADLVLVAGAIDIDTYMYYPYPASWQWPITHIDIQQWLMRAQQLNPTDLISLRGITLLTDLLAVLTPQETALFQNYPNPFNPETWIPYTLSAPADVTLRIYSTTGAVVRTLALGYQFPGIYQHQSKAAYWDGRNEQGEPVANGVYFYTLTAGDFTATRKMLIRE